MSNAIAITQDPIDINIPAGKSSMQSFFTYCSYIAIIKSNMKATTIPEIYIVNISYSHLDVFV